eukprot:TRINITY_DN431_c0_g1_i1.p1 TRINITY_DN431_c0_g1~~TRINITY_DN431_c0_g1_i1.p1  ORF type:complete len:217 (+),score=35.49 TRINITY_DN431_c0_g1_i1:92-652(+)
MSYKPLHQECDKVVLITSEPTKHTQAATFAPTVPRHSIAISLTLAVISYCCCSALGIIPIIMVVFAYVKRENGKAVEATRMSNYSRVVSGIVIALAVLLLLLTILWFIGMAAISYYSRAYGDDAIYDYYYPDDMVYPPDYYEYHDDVTDGIDQIDEIIDEITDYGTEEPDYFNGPLDYDENYQDNY